MTRSNSFSYQTSKFIVPDPVQLVTAKVKDLPQPFI